MAVNTNIPTTIRRPGSYTNIDGSNALQGSSAKPISVLLVGQKKLGSGTAVDGTIYPITGDTGGDAIFGVGSQVAEMARAFKAVTGSGLIRLSGVSLADDASGVAASGSVVFATNASSTGVHALYFGGVKVPVLVTSGDTPTTQGAALVAALAANPRLGVTGVNTTGSVAITMKWDGPSGNAYAIEKNLSPDDAAAAPGATTVTITAMASGATAPSVASLIAALPTGVTYDYIVSGMEDDATMDAFEAEALARWAYDDQRSTILVAGFRGAYAAASTYLSARNAYLTTVPCQALAPTPPWIFAAVHAAILATEADPARPLNTLVYTGCVAPQPSQRFTDDERELLLHEGGSTMKIDDGGQCIVERIITTYVTNTASLEDPTWLDVTTPRTLAYLRWSWNARLTTKFPRHKAGNDGARPRPGQPIVTPSTLRAELIGWGDQMFDLGLIEQTGEELAALCLVERNAQDSNRFDVFMPPDLVNGAHIFANSIGFRL
jgi:phage tail sheath gpL-like